MNNNLHVYDTPQTNPTERSNITHGLKLTNHNRITPTESYSHYHHGWTDQSVHINQTYYTDNNYSIDPDDDFYSGCWNINHYYRQQSFSRQFWYYQLSWQRTLATVESFKADVSSVNPSSERSRELSCYTLPPTQLNRFFINLPPSQEYPHPDDWTTRSNLQLQMPFESDVRERFC